MKLLRATAVVLAVLAPLGCSPADPPPESTGGFAATTAAAEAAIESGVASVTVLFAQRGEIVFEQSWGWADREREVAATPDTPYSLASISKPITATALMTLVEQGLVDLDRPVNDYLSPEGQLTARVGDAADATVRRVANHTSGLPLHYQFFYLDEEVAPPSRDATIARYGNLVSAPGERFQYSNLGYGVLDHVLTRVTELDYADALRRAVFDPLGLEGCAAPVGRAAPDGAARRYDGRGQALPYYDFDHPGGSAVYCSARDLAAFGSAQLGFLRDGATEILSAEGRAEMARPTSQSGTSGYGVSWGSRTVGEVTRLGHSGGMPGVSTTLVLVPEEDAALVVLMNSSGPLFELTETFLHDALPQHFEGPPADDDGDEEELPPLPFDGRWQGRVVTHRGETPLELEIRDDGEVFVQLSGTEPRAVERARIDDHGFLRGTFEGTLSSDDVDGRRGDETMRMGLELKPDGDRLRGAVVTFRDHAEHRGHSALSHWAELSRSP